MYFFIVVKFWISKISEDWYLANYQKEDSFIDVLLQATNSLPQLSKSLHKCIICNTGICQRIKILLWLLTETTTQEYVNNTWCQHHTAYEGLTTSCFIKYFKIGSTAEAFLNWLWITSTKNKNLHKEE